MFSQKDSETSASETWATIRPGIVARIEDLYFNLLLAGIVLAVCIAVIGYLIEVELREQGWKLRRMLHDDARKPRLLKTVRGGWYVLTNWLRG